MDSADSKGVPILRNTAQRTRQCILDAADRLFYGESLAAVSMARIAERAGVTKRTLYYHFRSKDELMAAYLESRHDLVMERYGSWAGSTGTAADRIERMFRRLALSAPDRKWRGCGFIRAACELADRPGHPAFAAACRHKSAFEMWLRNMLQAEGHSDAEYLSHVLMVLLDGALVQTLVHRRGHYALAAASAARQLLSRASSKPVPCAA